jgi:hypothetical protein
MSAYNLPPYFPVSSEAEGLIFGLRRPTDGHIEPTPVPMPKPVQDIPLSEKQNIIMRRGRQLFIMKKK